MQHNKSITNFSEIGVFAKDSETLASTLSEVIGKFKLKSHLATFDALKSKGLAISSIVSILTLLPFYGVSSVYAFIRNGIKKSDIRGKKDVYYDVKNNEFIDWRTLLLLHAKRFRYLMLQNQSTIINGIRAIIFDDTPIEKTGKKTEKLSSMFDHVSGGYIFGYKLLVCGFWDGGSFIPLDFSFHREKGTKNEELIRIFKKAQNVLEKTKCALEKCTGSLSKKELALTNWTRNYELKPNKTNKIKLTNAKTTYHKVSEEHKQYAHDLVVKQKEFEQAKKKLKQFYQKGKLFGLTTKERKEQFKKDVANGSFGHTRRREADKSKIDMTIEMLSRSVKHGFVPDYVLIDSWFFCFEILEKLSTLKNGAIKLVSMVKINNQKFFDCKANKEMPIKMILKRYERESKTCKSLKAKYIKVTCKYKGIRVNLFFVKMGRSQNWHLLLTTNLTLSFIDLMEVYQIRWSIEVFFKECKQHLYLGKCKSSCFDAQIADTTVAMLQHIMLSYYKRISCQQSFSGLFEAISKEMVELDLVSRMIGLMWELIEVICSIVGFDFVELQEQLIKDDRTMAIFIKMLPERVLNKAA
ncbi:MAG: transposase [Sulfurimicrobium sp.]|nr:transposase [Bacteroidota bacterium]MDP2962012.1 transposase [Sulfurimicrobium sp.]